MNRPFLGLVPAKVSVRHPFGFYGAHFGGALGVSAISAQEQSSPETSPKVSQGFLR